MTEKAREERTKEAAKEEASAVFAQTALTAMQG